MKPILVIGGSDSGGGAGIQADIKTITTLGFYATSVITALTAQNTMGLNSIFPINPDFTYKQIECIAKDFNISCVKIGMLNDKQTIIIVVKAMDVFFRNVPIILDPIINAGTGEALLSKNCITELTKLFAKATLITPNIPEAEFFLKRKINNVTDMKKAAKLLIKFGSKYVLIKGGHLNNSKTSDVLYNGKKFYCYNSPKINSINTHGTGCTLASAIASGIASDLSVNDSVKKAHKFVHKAIKSSYKIGHGSNVLNYLFK